MAKSKNTPSEPEQKGFKLFSFFPTPPLYEQRLYMTMVSMAIGKYESLQIVI